MRRRTATAVLAATCFSMGSGLLSPGIARGDDISQAPSNTAAPAPLGLGGAAPASSTSLPGSGGPAAPAAPGSTAAANAAAGGDLELGRAAIDRKDWQSALTALKRAAATDPKNADVQNLLGFAARNLGDYPGALAYYAKALTLDPKHRGALEYRGEAYVKLGQLSKAKADLAALKKICGTGCEQYRDLSKAIAGYKPAPKATKKR